MLGLSEPGSILTFVVLEVVFHLRPPIMLAEVDWFHYHDALFAWQCVMIGFEFLKARQLLLYKREHKGWTILASYMLSLIHI